MEETINRSMIIEANSYPGAIIAYMDWFERPGIQYDDTGRFLGWAKSPYYPRSSEYITTWEMAGDSSKSL